jgi:hypothetical protein
MAQYHFSKQIFSYSFMVTLPNGFVFGVTRQGDNKRQVIKSIATQYKQYETITIDGEKYYTDGYDLKYN